MGNPLGLHGPASYVDDGTSARMAVLAGARDWPKSEWSKAAQTDIP